MINLAHVKLRELRGTPDRAILSEVLVEVNNYPAYQVSNLGYVIGARGKTLAEDTNSGGYKRITLCKNGIPYRVFIHRLVAEHFVPNPDGYKYVNHIDGDRTNNEASNLEWCTASYNILDGWKRGRIHFATGKRATTIFSEE